MSNSEIIRTLAEKCMGWSVFGLLESGYGELIGDRLIENVAHDWIYFPSGATWSTEGLKAWNPLSSIPDALMLVPPMRAKGFSFSLQTSIPGTPDATKAAFSHSENGEDFVRVDAELCRAICLAAIAALEGK